MRRTIDNLGTATGMVLIGAGVAKGMMATGSFIGVASVAQIAAGVVVAAWVDLPPARKFRWVRAAAQAVLLWTWRWYRITDAERVRLDHWGATGNPEHKDAMAWAWDR